MANALDVKGFSLTYPGAARPVFEGLDLTVVEGETVALRGESGAGKSSLLLCACGLIPGSIPAETSGGLLLFGRPPAAYSRAELCRGGGMVFQNPETQLFCGTAELELAFGLENLRVPREEMRGRVREALEAVGLWQRRGEAPSRLSGGQKQLLALAAVLALKPRLLLLDEALSQLDAPTAARMMELLLPLKAAGQSMLFVDHNETRCQFADRIVEL